MRKFLNPRNDVAFKRMFGTEKNKDILISLINEVLRKQFHKQIINVTFLSTFQDPDREATKQSIVDILCEDEDNCKYIIEMQVAERSGFEERAQYYAYKAYVSQMKKGDLYEDLKEVIFLAFTDYEIFPKKKSYKSEHITLDTKTYERDLNKISFTFVDLVKFNKQCPNDLTSLSLEEKFYYFLSNADDISKEDSKKLIGEHTIINRAFEELDAFNWVDEEWRKYEDEEKGRKDNFEALVYAEKKGKVKGLIEGKNEGLIEGKKEGLVEGKKEGLIEGKKEGLIEGKKEGNVEGRKEEKIEIAINMLNKNIDISLIKEITGLQDLEINELYKQLEEKLP